MVEDVLLSERIFMVFCFLLKPRDRRVSAKTESYAVSDRGNAESANPWTEESSGLAFEGSYF